MKKETATANISQYKVGNNASIGSFVRFWKLRLYRPITNTWPFPVSGLSGRIVHSSHLYLKRSFYDYFPTPGSDSIIPWHSQQCIWPIDNLFIYIGYLGDFLIFCVSLYWIDWYIFRGTINNNNGIKWQWWLWHWHLRTNAILSISIFGGLKP